MQLLQSLAPLQAAAPADVAVLAGDGLQKREQRDRRLRAALVYRMGQKQLARTWLIRAKGELRNLVALMRDMQAKQDAMVRNEQ